MVRAMDATTHDDDVLVLPPDAGEHFHFLNHLATVKVPSNRRRALTAVEFRAPVGFGPPPHRHQDEDELFVVLDGEVRFFAGDTESIAGRGSTVFLPHGLVHGFQVVSDEARFLTITGSVAGTPTFDQMVRALGTPLDEPVIPEPVHIDATRVADVCREHGIEIVGPPPTT